MEGIGNSPLVSVFIPAYNVEEFIIDAINSILNQTYVNIEVIVVDDASTDQTFTILESLSKLDNRIKLYRNEKNLGLALNRNKGLKYCTGKYIALMDSDDISVENRIKLSVEFLEENSDYDAITSWMQIFDRSGKGGVLKYRSDFELIKISSIFFSPLAHAAAMFKGSILKDLGYTEDVNFGEDYDLWLRFLQKYKVFVSEEVLYLYRSHQNQSIDKSKSEYNKIQLQKVVDRIYSILKIDLGQDWKIFHVKYLILQENLTSKDDFFKWNAYFEVLYKASLKSSYLDSKKFMNFVFLNYWQNYYIRYLHTFTFKEILRVNKQKFNNTPFAHKMKILILKIVK